MKSIKEKAEELVKKSVELSREESIAYFQGIEEGTNYVLEQLEEFLNLYGVYCINSSAKSYLKDMIEQLKGNQ